MGEDRLLALAQRRPWAMSGSELVAAVDAAHGLVVEAQALLLRLLRQVEVAKTASAVSASSAGVWYRNRHRVAIRSAHRLVRVAKRVAAAPQVLGEAVAGGAVNLDQADVVTQALARIPREVGVEIREQAAAALVELCAELDPDQLRQVGARILSLVAPEVADELDRKAMEREAAQAERERYVTLTPDGVGADALVDVCRLALATTDLPTNGGDRPQVVVGVDFDMLKRELTAGTLDNGDRITPEAARRMACDAGLIPMILHGHGVALDVGRSRRSVPGPLRRALAARDRGCAFPGCDRDARWCDAHHLRHWSYGGPTALDNLVLVCSYHHGELHKPDNWTAFIDIDGRPTFIPPTHIDPPQRPRRNRYHRRR